MHFTLPSTFDCSVAMAGFDCQAAVSFLGSSVGQKMESKLQKRKATSSKLSPQIQETIDPESVQRLQKRIRDFSEPEQRDIIENLVTCQFKPESHIFKLRVRGGQPCISVSAFLKDWDAIKAAERYDVLSSFIQVTTRPPMTVCRTPSEDDGKQVTGLHEILHRDDFRLALTNTEQPSSTNITIREEETISKQVSCHKVFCTVFQSSLT